MLHKPVFAWPLRYRLRFAGHDDVFVEIWSGRSPVWEQISPSVMLRCPSMNQFSPSVTHRITFCSPKVHCKTSATDMYLTR